MAQAEEKQISKDEVSLLVEHSIRYTNQQPLTVSDVVNSLNSLNKLSVYFLPAALSSLSGADIVTAELLVEGFEEGSFVQKVLIKLFFRDEDELDVFLGKIREGGRDLYRSLPGEGRPVLKHTVAVTCVVGALISTGAVWAIATRTDTPSPVTLNIENSNFVIIGAEAYQTSPAKFVEVIEAVGSTDKKKLAQSAAQILAPAKREEDAEVEMGGVPQLTISHETIEAVPDNVVFEPFEIDQPHPDVDVQIRASDRDNLEKGWAGVIPGIVDRRKKLILSEGIDPESIANNSVIRADVIVKSRMSRSSKKMEPVSITITALVTE